MKEHAVFRQNYTILKTPGDECDKSVRFENCSEYRSKFYGKRVSAKKDTDSFRKNRAKIAEQKRKHLDGQLQLFPPDKKTLTVKLGNKGKLRFESTKANDLRARANQPDPKPDRYWHMPRFERVQSTGASIRK